MSCDNVGFELECDDDVTGGIAEIWVNALDNIGNYEVGGAPTSEDITKINLNGVTTPFKFNRITLRTKPAAVADFAEPAVGEKGVTVEQKLTFAIDSFISAAARAFKKYAQKCKCGFVFLVQTNAEYLGLPGVLIFASDPKTQRAATPTIVFGGTPIVADPQPNSGITPTSNTSQTNEFSFSRTTTLAGMSRQYVGVMDSTLLNL